MVLQKVEDTKESSKQEKVKIVVVTTLPTQEVREAVVNGEKVRFITIEEYLTSIAN